MKKKNINTIVEKLPIEDSIKKELKEAWNSNFKIAVKDETAKINEGLHKKFNKDLATAYKAFEKYINEKLNPVIDEYGQEISAVRKIKEKYAEKATNLKEDNEKQVMIYLEEFKKYIDERFNESFQEILEDQIAYRKAAVAELNDFRQKKSHALNRMKKLGGKALKEFVEVIFVEHLKKFKEDVEAARKDNFGMEIFEAVQNTYRQTFLNTNKEFRTIMEDNERLRKDLSELKSTMKGVYESKEKELKIAKRKTNQLQEQRERDDVISKLLAPLKGSTKTTMKTILENTETKNLERVFKTTYKDWVKNKQEPSNLRQRANLTENLDNVKIMTGGSGQRVNPELEEIRRLAHGDRE